MNLLVLIVAALLGAWLLWYIRRPIPFVLTAVAIVAVLVWLGGAL